LAAVAAVAALTATGSAVRGDVLKFKNGEELDGEILLERPDKVFFRTLAGAKWIARIDLAEIVKAPSLWQKYAELKKKFPSTALGHFELAMWCGENKLVEERERHLKMAVALDVTFEPAFLALGFVKDGDKWLPPRKETVEIPRKVVPAEKAVPTKPDKAPGKLDEESERRRNRWAYDISTIYNRSLARADPEARLDGAKRILAIKDPLAVDGLIDQLAARKDPSVRRLCARTLAGIGTDRAIFQITVMAVTDSNTEVMQEACALLKRINDPRVVPLLRKGLEGPEDLLERCVLCLGELKDWDSVPNLVAVVVGRERPASEDDPDGVVAFWRIAQSNIFRGLPIFEPEAFTVNSDVTSQLLGNSGPIGRKKNKRPGEIPQSKFRASVQEALIRISERTVNFSSDQSAWMEWYKKASAERARRP
jgi:hypothetical protein